jgi:hypothetical protein
MLVERAQKDEEMKYPMKNLRNVVNLAFRSVPNLEELSTPFRLVDEMLDHYRKEVIKFSLESNNYHAKQKDLLDKYLLMDPKGNKKGNSNADRAILYINIPTNYLQHYADKFDISQCIVKEYVLNDYNDPASNKRFYDSISDKKS